MLGVQGQEERKRSIAGTKTQSKTVRSWSKEKDYTIIKQNKPTKKKPKTIMACSNLRRNNFHHSEIHLNDATQLKKVHLFTVLRK